MGPQHNQLLYNLPANAFGSQLLHFSLDGQFFLNTDEEGDVIRVWQLIPSGMAMGETYC